MLGDCTCVFETVGKRRFKPLSDEDDELRRVFLPISHDRILVGTPIRSDPQLDLGLLNRASSRCSYEFFVSATRLRSDSPLLKTIGDWSGVLNDQELNALMNELKTEWPKAL
jgi:hypothetical protein